MISLIFTPLIYWMICEQQMNQVYKHVTDLHLGILRFQKW